MKFVRRSGDTEPSVNLTPLIDIVFLLLIFFMVSSRFVDERELALELPSATTAVQSAASEALIVDITPAGGYRVEGRPTAPLDLLARLGELRADQPGRALRIRAAGDARHEAVVRALDAASQAGFERVDIATRSSR